MKTGLVICLFSLIISDNTATHFKSYFPLWLLHFSEEVLDGWFLKRREWDVLGSYFRSVHMHHLVINSYELPTYEDDS